MLLRKSQKCFYFLQEYSKYGIFLQAVLAVSTSPFTLRRRDVYSGISVSFAIFIVKTGHSFSCRHLTHLNFGSHSKRCLFMKSAPKMTDLFSPLITRNGCSVLCPNTEMGKL
jgi:hypothetical protein